MDVAVQRKRSKDNFVIVLFRYFILFALRCCFFMRMLSLSIYFYSFTFADAALHSPALFVCLFVFITKSYLFLYSV